MKIEIDTEKLTPVELDAVVAFLLQLKAGDPVEETSETNDDSQLKELSEAEVIYTVGVMNQHALGLKSGEKFKTPELYRLATGEKWLDLSPNTRKAIGRRFKKHTDDYFAEAWEGDPVVIFKGKTIQNSAIYEVTSKPEEEDK
jgi:hypothetical protein